MIKATLNTICRVKNDISWAMDYVKHLCHCFWKELSHVFFYLDG